MERRGELTVVGLHDTCPWTASVERCVFCVVKSRTMSHSLTHSLSCLLVRSLAYSLICSLTRSLIHARARELTNPLIHSRTHSLAYPQDISIAPHSCAYSLTHSFPLSLRHPSLPPSAMSPSPCLCCALFQLGDLRNGSTVGSFPGLRWAQTANHGYSPNPDQPNVFMAVAMDLPDFESPIGPLVSSYW